MSDIYLDNAATTAPHPEVIKAMVQYLSEDYGNPSSLYDKGIKTEKAIREVRRLIAKAINAPEDSVYFTSGGTEGNNTLIKGIVENQRIDKMRIITTAIEHPSVMEVFHFYEAHGIDVVYVPVDGQGKIDLDFLAGAIDDHTVLVSVMGVNNELGTIQDLARIGALIKEKNEKCLFHTDFVQGFMKVPVDVAACKIDALTLCGHKICGPKGIGAIYLRKGVRIKPLIIGGGQEKNLRSGTENVPGIAGLGRAVEIQQELGPQRIQRAQQIKEALIAALADVPDMRVNSPEDASPFVTSLSFKGVRGEVLLHSLEGEGIYVSTGSACSSHKKEKQYVLSAIHLPEEYKEGTIRVSFSIKTTEAEVLLAAEAIKKSVAQLRMLLRYKH
ncbi:MAG: cysteine desulfurase family protein [Eubacterium sp.]|nr:cysteine desulfurase family protein [Eubacterium sp.]